MIYRNRKSHIWRGAVGVLIGILAFLSSFLFNRVVALPETYVTISANKEMHQDQNERQEKLEKKIDSGFEQLQEQYREINKYLREPRGG